ncbi:MULTISPECIES: hypothetical protein [Catenuloplanes]|uniref:Uncharacterized protein n=1 Tax=Catenuloplanes niger TaxID=587534 RepID=A0AAE3ZP82_9ACTN|nr:hypothetical protein [Catenuloplanes niger]MDR7322265.1 hypothetical protein [Catenuloplanes niger]
MRIIRLIVGILLLTAGLPILLTAGGLWTAGQHRDPDGAFRATLEPVDVPGQALLVANLDGLLRRDAAFARAGDTRIRIAAVTDEGPAFVGLAPTAEATSYLRSARHTWVEQLALARGPLPVRAGTVAGSRTPVADPARQTFWTRSGTGALTWTADEIRDRDLALVVMTPNGRPAGTVAITAELRARWLTATTWGGLGGGLLLIIGGMLLLAWPARPRELVYVVEPDRLPDVAARLGPRASVIHAGDGGRPATRITSRPRRTDRSLTGARSRPDTATARPATLADTSPPAAETAPMHTPAPADAPASPNAPADPSALVNAPTPVDAPASANAPVDPSALVNAPTPAGSPMPVDAVPGAAVPGAAVDEHSAGAVAQPKTRTGSRPPVTPQLTWPPLTRDPAADTRPPIPAGALDRAVVGQPATVPAGTLDRAVAGQPATVPAGATPVPASPVPAGTVAAVPATDTAVPAAADASTATAGESAEPDTAEIVAPRRRANVAPAETAKVRTSGAAKSSAANAAKAPPPAAKAPARRATNAGAVVTRSAAQASAASAEEAPGGAAPDGGAPVKRQPRRKAQPKGGEPVGADADRSPGRGSGGTPAARAAGERDGVVAGPSVAGAGESSTVPPDGALDRDGAAPAPRAGRRRKAADGEVRPTR